MSAAKQATKYLFAIATVYMCYLTHGVQAIIFSQNQVNFYTQWGFTDATAGAAAVSTAIMWVGIGKFISVWIGGEISDRIGRKIMAVGGGVLYIISFVIMLVTDNATVACVAGFLSGVATSGFWDGSLYPAIAEANPRYSASTTIGIKLVISISGIVYPLFVAMNSGANWHINVTTTSARSRHPVMTKAPRTRLRKKFRQPRTLCSSSLTQWLMHAPCSSAS